MPRLDHAAFPCFDVEATHRFYADVLGLPLLHAQTGSAEVWKASSYLLVAYGLEGGGAIDFFTFDGITRPPPDGLPKDIRHLALALATRADVLALHERLKKAQVPAWTETHDAEDIHVYATDPNGIVLEIVAEQDGSRACRSEPVAAKRLLDAWVASHRT